MVLSGNQHRSVLCISYNSYAMLMLNFTMPVDYQYIILLSHQICLCKIKHFAIKTEVLLIIDLITHNLHLVVDYELCFGYGY